MDELVVYDSYVIVEITWEKRVWKTYVLFSLLDFTIIRFKILYIL